MSRNEPARLIRVTGYGDDLFGLDEDGTLWSFEYRQYKMVWIQLPLLIDPIVDLYVHIVVSDEGAVERSRTALRVLDQVGRLWELRWAAPGEYLWEPISLEAR
jgi:hypothetical protein